MSRKDGLKRRNNNLFYEESERGDWHWRMMLE